MIEVVLLGTGSPIPDPNRAGPSTLVRSASATLLVDCGRGVMLRLSAVMVGAGQLDALLLTHLHSDHITDLGDVITSRWVTSFAPSPLRIFGPPGTASVVEATLASLRLDVGYRLAHHEDLAWEPPVEVTELEPGATFSIGTAAISVAATDHRPVHPTIGYRVEDDGASVVLAGDTVPCAGLDELCRNADALVHTVIRPELIEAMPIQRFQDVCDYHSSVEQAGATASRGGVATLVLTHYVPALVPGEEDAWRALAASEFAGRIELGDDLHRVEVVARP